MLGKFTFYQIKITYSSEEAVGSSETSVKHEKYRIEFCPFFGIILFLPEPVPVCNTVFFTLSWALNGNFGRRPIPASIILSCTGIDYLSTGSD
jgi:hypothetical protein